MHDRASAPQGLTALLKGLAADPKHGPLPILLLGLTVVSGVIDAVSILSLGRVFVANMTGNVVFVGFAIAGAPGFSLTASLFALAGFLLGALFGGLGAERLGPDRGAMLRNAVGIEVVFIIVALIISVSATTPFNSPTKDAIAAIVAIALGFQNSIARRLAVPDLTTTVVTMALTGIAADVRARQPGVVVRRLLAVLTMLIGAIIGALLVLHVSPSAALGLAAGLLLVVSMMAAIAGRRKAAWNS